MLSDRRTDGQTWADFDRNTVRMLVCIRSRKVKSPDRDSLRIQLGLYVQIRLLLPTSSIGSADLNNRSFRQFRHALLCLIHFVGLRRFNNQFFFFVMRTVYFIYLLIFLAV